MNMDTSMVDEWIQQDNNENNTNTNNVSVIAVPIPTNTNLVVADVVVVESFDETPNYFDWKEFCPELQIFIDNIGTLQNELKSIANQPVRYFIGLLLLY